MYLIVRELGTLFDGYVFHVGIAGEPIAINQAQILHWEILDGKRNNIFSFNLGIEPSDHKRDCCSIRSQIRNVTGFFCSQIPTIISLVSVRR